jgi:hypothetical protein
MVSKQINIGRDNHAQQPQQKQQLEKQNNCLLAQQLFQALLVALYHQQLH